MTLDLTTVLTREAMARARDNALPEPTPVIPSMTEEESRLLELRVELRRSLDELLHAIDQFQTILCTVVDELQEQAK